MNASLHFKDERDNHRVIAGPYAELKDMTTSVDDISWDIKHRSDYARMETALCTGITPASPVFICIEGGKK